MKTGSWTLRICGLALVWAVAGAPRAFAQPPSGAGERTEQAPTLNDQPRVDYDSEAPYTLYERYWNRRFPAPYRRQFRREYYPFGRPYYPRRYRDRYPRGYGCWHGSPYGFGDFGTTIFDDGYVGGFHDGRRFQKWQTKAELGLNSYLKAMQQGNAAFRSGDYGSAARQFILAAKLNQGDPASRLHTVHALVALGHYADAVPALRRAVQLQPRLLFLPLDIRGEYGQPEDFAVHLGRLADAAETHPDDAGLWLLLGYYQFFSDAGPAAARSLSKAAELAPDDSVARRLYQAARLSAPARQTPADKPKPALADDGV